MRDGIYVTNDDWQMLRQLIAGRGGATRAEDEYLDALERELDRAELVEPEAIPRDVITMNSEVRLEDLNSGDVRVYRLIFPAQTGIENSISVLAPIGTAMLVIASGTLSNGGCPRARVG
jgi:regulator of nucleoside diphosphate kinase